MRRLWAAAGVVAILLPFPARGAPPPAPPLRALPAGDLDGDGVQDAVALDGTTVWALRGSDGRPLWSVDLAGATGIDALAAGDLTGDGAADVLVTVLTPRSRLVLDDAFTWEAVLLEGPNGYDVWFRQGGSQSFGGGLVSLNALKPLQLAGDVTGDGATEVVLDLSDTVGEDLHRTLGTVVDGRLGRTLFSKQSGLARRAVLLGAGDMVAGPQPDVLWAEEPAVPPGEEELEAWDVAGRRMGWARSIAPAEIRPLGADVTGDGRADLLFEDGEGQGVISGASGEVAWRRPPGGHLFVPPLGRIGQAVAVLWAGDGRLERLSGATGELLLRTERAGEVSLVSDGDGDGVREVVAGGVVESGATGTVLAEAEGRWVADGDLDGDGRADLLDAVAGPGSVELRAVRMAEGTQIWSRTDPARSYAVSVEGGSVLYVRDAVLDALDGQTGSLRWEFSPR